MERERIGYVVVTYNRYGGKPFVGFMHDTLGSAMESRDESARVSKPASQERHVVAEVFEVEPVPSAPVPPAENVSASSAPTGEEAGDETVAT